MNCFVLHTVNQNNIFMKTKILFTFYFICITASIFAEQQNCLSNIKEIDLSCKRQSRHRTVEPYISAFRENNLLIIYSNIPIEECTITITNLSINSIVISGTHFISEQLPIDMSNADEGEYSIEIVFNGTILYGKFNIDNLF